MMNVYVMLVIRSLLYQLKSSQKNKNPSTNRSVIFTLIEYFLTSYSGVFLVGTGLQMVSGIGGWNMRCTETVQMTDDCLKNTDRSPQSPLF